MRVLLIEDDEEFAGLIVDFLHSRSIDCEVCTDPYMALIKDFKKYDLLLLDLGLPGLDGLEVCKDIRAKSKIPIIISSARSSVSDKVLGLGLGADDYLPKPYDPDELYARISSLIRRSRDEFDKKEQQVIFEIDEQAYDIKFLDNYLRLTDAEFQVCKALIKNKNALVSKEQLLGECSTISTSDGGKSLEVIISKIRHKIKAFSDKNYIIAARGRGYRLVG